MLPMIAHDALTLTRDLSPLVATAVDPYSAMNAEERRVWRARFDEMLIVPRVDLEGDCSGMYDVFRPDGSIYTVDLVGQSCDCPFGMERDEPCKHVIRVVLAMDETPLPAPGADVGDYWAWFDGTIQAIQDEAHLAAMSNRALNAARDMPTYDGPTP